MDYTLARVRLCPCNDGNPQASVHRDGTLTCSECGATMKKETDMHSNNLDRSSNRSRNEELEALARWEEGNEQRRATDQRDAEIRLLHSDLSRAASYIDNARIIERDETTRTASDATLIANELRETADLYMEDKIDIEDLREQNKITWTEARRLNVVETVRSILRNQANLTNEGR